MKTLPNRPAFRMIRQLLAEGREVSVRVEGESMLPFFRSGERIRLRPLRNGDLRRGHVVLAETDSGQFVIHRIAQVGNTRVLLRGDGNPFGRESVPRERICGTVECTPLHLLLARIWMLLGPLRCYPLRLLRRILR